MSKKIKVKGKIRALFNLLLGFGGVLVLFTILAYFIVFPAGIVLTAFLLLYFTGLLLIWIYFKPLLLNEMVSFATEYGQVQRQLLRDLELPHALLDDKGKIIWTNDAFEELVKNEKGYRKNISSLFPSITTDKLPLDDERDSLEIEYEEQNFLVKMRRISVTDMIKDSDFVSEDGNENYLIGLYLFDQTALKLALRENDDQSLVVGLIYIDNYEEAMEGVEEVRQSLLYALIDRKINKWAASVDGIVRKIEKDKYLLILRKKSLAQLKESRFEILEEVKTVNMGNEIAITLSIGIGLDGLSYSQNSEFARAAIDLALGRGGDQAVIKTPGAIQYFGGKTQQQEKNTRVKARVKAQALQEILSTRDQIFIMGHTNADVDSFGASVGVQCIARQLQKKAYIVLDSVNASLKPVVDMYLESVGNEEDVIIGSSQALERANANSVLVVVDNNIPSRTECPDLIKNCKAIVVLDHHRQTAEHIENATLSYVEPYASSASEMVAEILQYVDNGVRIKSTEADIMYAGIVIDTNLFTTKTGVRTFEAAAYLRRSGADVTRVRKMFREDAGEYMAKAKTIRDAFIYRNDFALSVCDSTSCQSPTVAASKAANELLNINGVKASFVFTEYQGKIHMSARSIDEVNVQVIAEKIGGGGHMSASAAQLEGMTIEDAINLLEATLDSMIENEEI